MTVVPIDDSDVRCLVCAPAFYVKDGYEGPMSHSIQFCQRTVMRIFGFGVQVALPPDLIILVYCLACIPGRAI
jgi:hypothetical protein